MRYNLDLELERVVPGIEPIVPTSVIRELSIPSKSRDRNVKAALKLAEKYEKMEIKGKGDGPLFNLAVNKGWMVMTQDKRLRDKLLSRGISVIIIRGKGHLEIMDA